MSKVEKILKNDSVNLMTLLSNLGCEITGNQNIILETIKINIKKSNESYHQSRVNAISDEAINAYFDFVDNDMELVKSQITGQRAGARWFKNKLLKQ